MYRLLVLVVLANSSMHGLKIKDRFDWPRIRAAQCRILNVKFDSTFVGLIYRTSHALLAKLNCSDVFAHSVATGHPDAYGNYSGSVGMLQRDEAEFVFQGIRADAIVSEPVKIGPIFASGEVALYTRKQDNIYHAIDTMDFYKAFDNLVYSYFLITLLLAAVYLSFFLLFEHSCKRKLASFTKKLIKIMWALVQQVIGQANYEPISWPTRIAWLFLQISLFIAIVGILRRLMPTDRVASTPVARIDSLYDLFSPTFAHYQPIIVGELYTYDLLAGAKPGSMLGYLYQRMMQNPSIGVVQSDVLDSVQLQHKVLSCLQRNSSCTMVLERFMGEELGMRGMCYMQPHLARNVHRSKESFAEGTIAWFFNQRIDAELQRYLIYQLATFNEFDLNRLSMHQLVDAAVRPMRLEFNVDVMTCIANHEEKADYAKMAEYIALQIIRLEGTLRVCYILLMYCCLVLVLEICFNFGLRLAEHLRVKDFIRKFATYTFHMLMHHLQLPTQHP